MSFRVRERAVIMTSELRWCGHWLLKMEAKIKIKKIKMEAGNADRLWSLKKAETDSPLNLQKEHNPTNNLI